MHFPAPLRLIVSVLFAGISIAMAQNRPFPQALQFAQCSKPASVSQEQMNQTIREFWQQYKTAYIKPSNGVTPGGGYYVEMLGTGGDGSEKGTSESQGYGMILSVLLAGADSEAKTLFDGLYNMYDKHRSTGNPHLMSWVVPASENSWEDQGSATDGDMDIAYALLMAHYQWGSQGRINYLQQAQRIITEGIKVSEMGSWSKRTLLGDWVGSEQLQTRPSDWMPGHMEAYYEATGDSFWLDAKNKIYEMVGVLHRGAAATSGLLPDFVINDPPQPAYPYFLEFAYDGDFFENACRCPLRLGVDFAHHGGYEARQALDKMAKWVRQRTAGDPARITKGYTLAGEPLNDSLDMLHFTAPLVVAAMVDPAHRNFLDSGWNTLRFTTPQEYWDHYYPNSITLLSMLLISGNWWPPVANPSTAIVPAMQTASVGAGQQAVVRRLRLGKGTARTEATPGITAQGRTLQPGRARGIFPSGIFFWRKNR